MSILHHTKQYLANQTRFKSLNAFVSLPTRAAVEARAQSADDTPGHNVRNSPRGKLIGIKDNICTFDFPTTASSGILQDFTSPYDATVVKQLRDVGAIIAGKTNMDEFGMGSHSIHSVHGPVKLSRYEGEELSAGGSSGGSAMAVASAQCWAALGTDTGGSVRLPASYTGVVGFKPSYGLVSRWGVIAYANSLDTVGILGGDVESVESIFDTLNIYDPQDPTSLPASTRGHLRSSRLRQPSLKIGIPSEYNISSLHPTVRRAWIQSLKLLRKCGHSLHAVNLPTTQHALSAYYVLAPAEASSNLAKYDGVRYGNRAEGIDGTPSSVLFAKTRGQFIGAEVRRRILLGAFSLSAQAIDNYFIQAQKVRRLVADDFNQVFEAPNQLVAGPFSSNPEGMDVLLCPTAPTLAPSLSEIEDQDPVHAYMNDVFTVPASLAGLPAISVPVPIAEKDRNADLREREIKESAGMQIIGQYGNDDLVLNVARQLEQAINEGELYNSSAPFTTAWGASTANIPSERPSPQPQKYKPEYIRGSKNTYAKTQKRKELRENPPPKVERQVKVPGYGWLDSYPTTAAKRERKRLGAKAKDLGITLEEYMEIYLENGVEKKEKPVLSDSLKIDDVAKRLSEREDGVVDVSQSLHTHDISETSKSQRVKVE